MKQYKRPIITALQNALLCSKRNIIMISKRQIQNVSRCLQIIKPKACWKPDNCSLTESRLSMKEMLHNVNAVGLHEYVKQIKTHCILYLRSMHLIGTFHTHLNKFYKQNINLRTPKIQKSFYFPHENSPSSSLSQATLTFLPFKTSRPKSSN